MVSNRNKELMERPRKRMFAQNPTMISHIPLPGGEEVQITRSPGAKRMNKEYLQSKDHFTAASGMEVNKIVNEANVPHRRAPGLLRPPPSNIGAMLQNVNLGQPPSRIPMSRTS